MLFRFDNTYARQLEGLYAPWQPARVAAPSWVKLNRALAVELGLDAEALATPEGLAILAGNQVPEGAQPLAQAYAGHQFGGFSPRLGDGRALLLGEVIDPQGRRRDIAFKGSGRTPFSRGGDGKAALGPVLREYLIGEAMHALGVPSTRALAVVATGERVFRESALPGAVLCRVASSHLRVGTFEYAAATGDLSVLRRLADHAIARHDPGLAGSERPYLGLLRAVCDRQAALVARWMLVGFIHGVMNTDNMTISGETIDYGPCAFLDRYDPNTVYSSIDHGGRYAYANQPRILVWNLTRLAEALLPLIDDEQGRAVALATEELEGVLPRYQAAYLAGLRGKLGLATVVPDDERLAADFLSLLATHRADFTLAFRGLADAAGGNDAPLLGLFSDPSGVAAWLPRWRQRLASEAGDGADAARRLRQVNPAFIPRNHRVEEALSAAVDRGDLGPFDALLGVLLRPFDEHPDQASLAAPAEAAWSAGYRTFCGT